MNIATLGRKVMLTTLTLGVISLTVVSPALAAEPPQSVNLLQTTIDPSSSPEEQFLETNNSVDTVTPEPQVQVENYTVNDKAGMLTEAEQTKVEEFFIVTGMKLNGVKIKADTIKSLKEEGYDSVGDYRDAKTVEYNLVDGEGLWVYILISLNDRLISVTGHPALVELMGDRYFTNTANILNDKGISRSGSPAVLADGMKSYLNRMEDEAAILSAVSKFKNDYRKILGIDNPTVAAFPTEAELITFLDTPPPTSSEEGSSGLDLPKFLIIGVIVVAIILLVTFFTNKVTRRMISTLKDENKADFLEKAESQLNKHLKKNYNYTLTEQGLQNARVTIDTALENLPDDPEENKAYIKQLVKELTNEMVTSKNKKTLLESLPVPELVSTAGDLPLVDRVVPEKRTVTSDPARVWTPNSSDRNHKPIVITLPKPTETLKPEAKPEADSKTGTTGLEGFNPMLPRKQ